MCLFYSNDRGWCGDGQSKVLEVEKSTWMKTDVIKSGYITMVLSLARRGFCYNLILRMSIKSWKGNSDILSIE